jgi:hypothetical protein
VSRAFALALLNTPAFVTMLMVEKQWVNVQEKTFTKW